MNRGWRNAGAGEPSTGEGLEAGRTKVGRGFRTTGGGEPIAAGIIAGGSEQHIHRP